MKTLDARIKESKLRAEVDIIIEEYTVKYRKLGTLNRAALPQFQAIKKQSEVVKRALNKLKSYITKFKVSVGKDKFRSSLLRKLTLTVRREECREYDAIMRAFLRIHTSREVCSDDSSYVIYPWVDGTGRPTKGLYRALIARRNP